MRACMLTLMDGRELSGQAIVLSNGWVELKAGYRVSSHPAHTIRSIEWLPSAAKGASND